MNIIFFWVVLSVTLFPLHGAWACISGDPKPLWLVFMPLGGVLALMAWVVVSVIFFRVQSATWKKTLVCISLAFLVLSLVAGGISLWDSERALPASTDGTMYLRKSCAD